MVGDATGRASAWPSWPSAAEAISAARRGTAPPGDRRDRVPPPRWGRRLQVPDRGRAVSSATRSTCATWPSAPCRPRWPWPPRWPPAGSSAPWPLRQPVGVVACITSYNFPLVNMAGKVAPALAMGNTVVVKPAAQDPLTVVELVRILEEVGFPPGVVNLVNSADAAPAAALVESTDVDMISFTGSTDVGTRIASAGGRTMKRLLLELGGKGACIVFDDAKLDAAVGCIGSTWSFHSGQICTAPTRAVVQRGVFDQVVEMLARLRRRPQGGRSHRARHDRGPAHLRRPARPGRGPHRHRPRRGRPARGRGRPSRAHGSRLLRRAHPVRRPTTTWPWPARRSSGPCSWSSPSTTTTRPSPSPTTATSASTTTCSRATRPGPSRWPSSCGPGTSGINTAQRNHEAPFGGLQDVRRRARRRRLRPGGVLGAAVDRLDRLSTARQRRSTAGCMTGRRAGARSGT